MKIMIAYDGSRNARLALARTITMFRQLQPRLLLVAVAENPRDITENNEALFNDEVAELKTCLAEASQVCQTKISRPKRCCWMVMPARCCWQPLKSCARIYWSLPVTVMSRMAALLPAR